MHAATVRARRRDWPPGNRTDLPEHRRPGLGALSRLKRQSLPRHLEPGRPGDVGLVGPDSVVWHVVREKAVLLGGPAALVMQVAHPLVAAGVVAHSRFRTEPFERLRRTLEATLTATFGDHDQAERVGRQVGAAHARVHGVLAATTGPFPAGTPYRAADPELAMWVHATLVVTVLAVFDAFVGRLSTADRNSYYEQSKPVARLFGVTDEVLPATYGEFEGYLRRTEEAVLAVGDEGRQLTAAILRVSGHVPGLPPAVGRILAGGLLSPTVRAKAGVRWGWLDARAFDVLRLGVRAGLAVAGRRARYWQHYLAATERLAGRRDRPG